MSRSESRSVHVHPEFQNHSKMDPQNPHHLHHEVPVPEMAEYELEDLVKVHPMFDPTKWPLYNFRYMFRDYLAEFWGTFILILFGDGVVATTKFNKTNGPSAYLSITFGWGIGLTMALYCSMGISGGHLNPAVTFANAVFGKFSWRKVPGYMFAQLLGAFTAAATLYGIFKDQFDVFDGGNRQLMGAQGTGGIWCTYPQAGNGKFFSCWSEIVNTAILLFVIYGIGDIRMTPAKNHLPISIGLLVFAIGNCTGWVTGYAINPARDFGPRIFSTILYGNEPFTFGGHYFWVPLTMPFVGAIVGIFFYQFFILPDDENKEKKD
ncbi:aquaporin-like protein [Coemansia biformis]|uniref:Aquaporin-like protein n=1 Tax=Coemansia biformis TaxID=1286918 RepID=A0A9W7Y9X8_9FUNG|nr:aquaporin-like protein [Coemansia biformis]